jgi:uncharacterized protein YukE
MSRITKEDAHTIWSMIESGTNNDDIVAVFPKVADRTLQRFRAVLNGFKAGKSDEELASGEWNKDTIAERRGWYEDYKRSKHGWSRQIHLEELFKSAQMLRDRIINPNLRMRMFDNSQSTWFLHGFDWRITPYYWYAMVVPIDHYLDSWIPNAESLLSHLKNSDFLKHYEQLKKGVSELNSKLDDVVNKLNDRNPSIKGTRKDIEIVISEFFVDGGNYIPGEKFTQDQVEALEEKLANYSEFMNFLIENFEKYYPELNQHCDELENLLQQVYDDLAPDTVSVQIESGRCSRCQ